MSQVVKSLEPEARLYSVANLPESDGKPLAETPKHLEEITNTLDVLQEYFRPQPEVVVYADIFVYYLNELGEIKRVSPDILVARGVAQEERRVYSVEREGKGPDLVIEFTSKKTKKIDIGKKRKVYAWLEVKEYFLFDPFGEYLKPRFQGFTLIGGEYVPMNAAAETRLHSEVLGLDLVVEKNKLRFYDPRTRERLRTHREAEAERRQAEAERRQAEAEREQAEAEREQAEAEREQAEAEREQETIARKAAEQQAQQEAEARRLAEEKVQQERAARLAAEAELERLREQLAGSRATK
jgi:Uma2 family endonuclease